MKRALFIGMLMGISGLVGQETVPPAPPAGHIYAYTSADDGAFVMVDANGPILKISKDGKITFGQGVDPAQVAMRLANLLFKNQAPHGPKVCEVGETYRESTGHTYDCIASINRWVER